MIKEQCGGQFRRFVGPFRERDLRRRRPGLAAEFTFLRENAKQARASGPLPPVERIDSGPISAPKFGNASPRVVFLDRAEQNAHTWETVVLGLGEPALAIDLPGHGRSAWRDDGDYGAKRNATAVESVIRQFGPDADLVVGMSGSVPRHEVARNAPQRVLTQCAGWPGH
jgi:pimeloyl-ACP methyl ester carboxylesterase